MQQYTQKTSSIQRIEAYNWIILKSFAFTHTFCQPLQCVNMRLNSIEKTPGSGAKMRNTHTHLWHLKNICLLLSKLLHFIHYTLSLARLARPSPVIHLNQTDKSLFSNAIFANFINCHTPHSPTVKFRMVKFPFWRSTIGFPCAYLSMCVCVCVCFSNYAHAQNYRKNNWATQ